MLDKLSCEISSTSYQYTKHLLDIRRKKKFQNPKEAVYGLHTTSWKIYVTFDL